MSTSLVDVPTSHVRLQAYLIGLPRWFGAPAAVLAVVLGGILTGAAPLPLALAVLSAVLLMAAAHSWNSFHDWMSGFDQGPPSERSHEKPYTIGQNLIARGVISPLDALLASLGYLTLSGVALVPLTLGAASWGAASSAPTLWVWLPWGLAALCAPLYSWGKSHYLCELFLGLGFGPLAALLGGAAGGDLSWIPFLAGIPLGLAWGYLAETVDQYLDADVNVAKGLRNLGSLAWRIDMKRRYGGSGGEGDILLRVILGITVLTIAAHIVLMGFGVLPARTGYAVVAVAPLHFMAPLWVEKKGLLAGLGLVFLYPLLIVLLIAV